MERVRLQPAHPGLVVAWPESRRALRESGEVVELNRYWRRRLSDGDVLRTEAAPTGVSDKGKPAATAHRAGRRRRSRTE